MSRYYASERAYHLAHAVTQMASRYGMSSWRQGMAEQTGTFLGKTNGHWMRAGSRQLTALHRLTNALRDVDVQQTPTPARKA